jgi:hypothetical protein
MIMDGHDGYEKLFPKGNNNGNMEKDKVIQMVQSCFSEFHKEKRINDFPRS